MPDFEITAPDGRTVVVTAPEGATPDQVMSYAQQQLAGPQLSMPRGSSSNIDMNREVGFFPRLAASLKMTPQGKEGFLQSIGYNAFTDRNGEQFVKDGKTVYPVNKRGLTAGDFADLGGDLAQAVPTMVVGTNPLTVGGAGAAGSAVRQGISELLPGKDDLSVGDRASRIGLDAALSMGGQGLFNKALCGTFSGAAKTMQQPPGFVGPSPVETGGMDSLRPSNIFKRMFSKAEDRAPETVQQSDAVARETGIQWSPAQRTQSKGLLTIEGMLRRNPMSADRWTEFDQKQLNQATQYLIDSLDKMRPGDVGSALAGGSTRDAFDNVLKGALKARSAQGRADFEAVDQLAGGNPVFGTMNAVKAIDEIIAKFDTPGGGDASAALVDKLKRLRSEFLPPAQPAGGNQVSSGLQGTPMALTGSQMQRLLQIYGEAARGTGSIFSDIDKAQQRLIARNVMDGLMQDVDEAAGFVGANGDAANALKTARENWKANSKVINDIESNVLGRMFGSNFEQAPERVAEKISTMRPTEIRDAFDLIGKAGNGAEVQQSVKRYLVEDAMRKAGMPDPGSMAPQGQTLGAAEFSPAKFVTAIKKSPVWNVLDANEKFSMETTLRAMERLRERAGTEGSPTEPLRQAWDMVKSLVSVNPVSIASGAASMAAPGKMTDLMITPQGRQALVKLSTTSPGSKTFAAASAYLGSLIARDQQ